MEIDNLLRTESFETVFAGARVLHMWNEFSENFTGILQHIAEIVHVPVTELLRITTKIRAECPSILQRLTPLPTDPKILVPRTSTCLMGCLYKTNRDGHFKGDPVQLSARNERPVQCQVCDLSGSKSALKFTLRCRFCGGDYSYTTFYSPQNKMHYLYENQQEYVEVSKVVFYSRELCDSLTRQILANQSTFQGLAEAVGKTYNENGAFRRQLISSAFFKYHIENELRAKGWHRYGLKHKADWSLELAAINKENAGILYEHAHSLKCLERGCGHLYCLDGLWKITHRICGYKIEANDAKFPLLNLPDQCPNQPYGSSRLCRLHAKYSSQRSQTLPEKLHNRADAVKDGIPAKTGHSRPSVKRLQGAPTPCKKALGERKFRIGRSRGYLFVVTAGGFVRHFSPIYGSESVSQVFYSTVRWLYDELQNTTAWPQDRWNTLFLAYDNMCNLDAILQSRQDLPFPEPYNKIWKEITKIIDRFHLDNHKRPRCKEDYNPDKLLEFFPQMQCNTQAAEQMFSYIGKFKNMLFNMSKEHQHFFLHTMILALNAKHQQILENGKFPIKINGRKRLQKVFRSAFH